MEITYEELKDKLADALYDIVKYDTPKMQRGNFRQLDMTISVMHDIFGICSRSQAIELRQMHSTGSRRVYRTKKEVKAAQTSTRNLYRIRKSWADSRSQLGAFANLQSAIDLATKSKGYKVFDDVGKEVFAETVKAPTKANSEFLARVTASVLNIRSGPGTNYKVNGTIRDKGTYTIVDTNGKWGKLKSGAGWIHLDYTKKL